MSLVPVIPVLPGGGPRLGHQPVLCAGDPSWLLQQNKHHLPEDGLTLVKLRMFEALTPQGQTHSCQQGTFSSSPILFFVKQLWGGGVVEGERAVTPSITPAAGPWRSGQYHPPSPCSRCWAPCRQGDGAENFPLPKITLGRGQGLTYSQAICLGQRKIKCLSFLSHENPCADLMRGDSGEGRCSSSLSARARL